MEIQQQEKNQLETTTGAIAASIKSHLDYIEQAIEQTKQLIKDHFDLHPTLKEQRDQLTTIPGIAEHSAAVLLGEMGNVQSYNPDSAPTTYSGVT